MENASTSSRQERQPVLRPPMASKIFPFALNLLDHDNEDGRKKYLLAHQMLEDRFFGESHEAYNHHHRSVKAAAG